ncbi:MAG: hypothetical protein CMF50_00395 [Legionellales bacterium]|nr:hypothetical protein [Legionellales bacterium]|tara:strand:- start:44330 stop:47455 length:3126 start_codon:yes stop_codon:yes gene_type:complete
MNFTDVFIRRPVFASALSLLVLVIGIVAFVQMPVRQYPMIETSVVTVTTSYPGASAELMSGFVSTPLENAIGSIDGIDYMTSTNVQNTSRITVNLQLGYPIETGVTDVGNQVSSVRWMLPKDIQDPVISKQDPNASPTVYIAFNSDTMGEEAVTDFLLRVVQPQLQTLDGVSEAEILGEREYAMRLNLDTERMASLGITPNDVMTALKTHNLQAATGKLEGRFQEYNITANTDMSTADQFNRMVIKTVDGHIVRLSDIGEAIMGAENYSSSAIINGKKTTVVGIIPQSDANPLAVSQEVDKIMPQIQSQLPDGIKANIVYDTSLFISESISEVYDTMIEASIFVMLVIFLFLGSIRSVIIPLITIPLSIIGVCGIMLALNYSINTITLLAWVLAIGLVVDDAIVVLENIHRHMEEGLGPIPASIIGAREIGFAVIAMTITLAAVYAPIGFVGGLTGILFSEFAFTLAASVIVSGFVALTLSPMMCSRILTYDPEAKGFAHYIDVVFEKIVHAYKSILVPVVKMRWLVILVALGLYVTLYFLFVTTTSELAPVEDQGVVLTYITGPSSSNIKYTEHYTDMIKPIFEDVPERDTYGIINGFPNNTANSAISFLNLIPWGDRKRSAMQISQDLFPKLWSIPGLKVIPITPPPLPAAGSFFPLQFVLKSAKGGDQAVKELNAAMQELMKAANQNPGFMGMDTDMKLDKPQVHVEIDRNKAGDLGISIQEIASALGIMFGTPEDVQFALEGRAYYVIPELDKNFNYLANPKDIDNIYVRAQSGDLVPLSNIVKVEERIEPQSLNHFQQLTSAMLNANLAPGYSLGEALKFLEDYTKQHFPDLQFDTAGQARQFIEAQGAMNAVLVFALIIIFLVLAAQFESYRDPFIVLFVVPLTLSGALLTLRIFGGTMNIYSQVGLTTLVGLIAKHGILIVEFANQLQEKGMNKVDAAIESAALRLRPILMTTGAMVLGAVPLAIASGAGANARHQIGYVIVGGMTIGTIFSLFVVPSVYAVFAKVKTVDEELEQEIADAIERAKHLDDDPHQA